MSNSSARTKPSFSVPDDGLQSVTIEHLPAIATIHIAAFPNSALTHLGSEAVRRYYEWQLIGPHQVSALSVYDGDALAGFCFGGRFWGAMSGFLDKNRLFLVQRMITHPWLMANPLVRDRFRSGIRILAQRSKGSPPRVARATDDVASFGILAIAVHPSKQGLGLGKRMMMAAEMEARQQGYAQMHLTVGQDNMQAVRFYEGLGWQRHLSAGLFQGRMTKGLANHAA